MRRIKETQKLKLGDDQGIPSQYFKKSLASKLGDAPVHPLLHQQLSFCPSFHYIFITSCVMHVLCLECLALFFLVYLVLLAVLNKLDPSIHCLGEKHTPLHCRTQHRLACVSSCVCSLSFHSCCHA